MSLNDTGFDPPYPDQVRSYLTEKADGQEARAEELRALLVDVWEYATGERTPFEAERAAAEGQTFQSLNERLRSVLADEE